MLLFSGEKNEGPWKLSCQVCVAKNMHKIGKLLFQITCHRAKQVELQSLLVGLSGEGK